MSSRSLSHRAPLLWVLLPWMAGLIAGYCWREALPVGGLLAGAVVSVMMAGAAVAAECRTFNIQHRTSNVLTCCSLLLLAAGVALAGMARYEMERGRLAEWDALALPAREARLVVEVSRVFVPKPGQDWVSGMGRVVGTEAHLRDVTGQRVYFSVARAWPGAEAEWAPTPGERLRVLGVLTPLPKHPDTMAEGASPFDGYLADSGVNFRFTRGQVEARVTEAGWYQRWLEGMRGRFSRTLGAGLETERGRALAGLYRAMVLGQKHELEAAGGEGRKELFLQSGTMHLFAISGLHVGVIALAIDCLLGVARVPGAWRFLAGAGLLWLYVAITGASPSAVRAWVMAVFLMGAWRLRLPGGSLAALTASAVMVLLIRPLELFTASFQLSYGIVAALLLLSVPLQEALSARWRLFAWLPAAALAWWQRAFSGMWRFVLGLGCMGLAATLVSMVAGPMFFGLFTPLAFLANLVLVPLAGLVLTAGFMSLSLGLLPGLEWASVVFNRAAGVVLWFMEAVARGEAALPGAFFAAEFRPAWAGPALLGGLLAVLALGYERKWPADWRGVAAPVGFVVLVLVLWMRFTTLPAS